MDVAAWRVPSLSGRWNTRYSLDARERGNATRKAVRARRLVLGDNPTPEADHEEIKRARQALTGHAAVARQDELVQAWEQRSPAQRELKRQFYRQREAAGCRCPNSRVGGT